MKWVEFWVLSFYFLDTTLYLFGLLCFCVLNLMKCLFCSVPNEFWFGFCFKKKRCKIEIGNKNSIFGNEKWLMGGIAIKAGSSCKFLFYFIISSCFGLWRLFFSWLGSTDLDLEVFFHAPCRLVLDFSGHITHLSGSCSHLVWISCLTKWGLILWLLSNNLVLYTYARLLIVNCHS